MAAEDHKQALPIGFELNNYRLVAVLGVGGFGITYKAHDLFLDRYVAIKEYLPNEFAMRQGVTVHPKSTVDREDFDWGLMRFLDEAKTLAKFQHRNVVRVQRFFEHNQTAYIVMDYEEGESLDRLLAEHGTLSETQLRSVLLPIVEGLREVHEAGILHRDIKPSNIYIRRSDESPVLLDFGAARQALGRKSKSLTAVASAGYSPPELYETDAEQGPWTDIYGLSALCYRAISGKPPVEAPRRQSTLLRGRPDPLPQLAGSKAAEEYTVPLLEAVDAGLRVIETQRPQNLEAWAGLLERVSPSLTDATASVLRVDALAAQDKVNGTDANHGRLWRMILGIVLLVIVSGVGLYFWTESRKGTGRWEYGLFSTDELRSQSNDEEHSLGSLQKDQFQSELNEEAGLPEPESILRSVGHEVLLSAGDTFADRVAAGGDGPEMVVIPPGRFRMGCVSGLDCHEYEQPVHDVRISSFALSKYEVTFAEFDACVSAGGCKGYRPEDRGWGRGNRPVINVSWQNAQSYVHWLSNQTGEDYRLPSESEWEYAARAKSETQYSWGNDIGRNRANCDDCGSRWDDRTSPVGSFSANSFGLRDLHGNVREWTDDCWNGNYAGAPTDGSAWRSGDCELRVLRGGSWLYGSWFLRSAYRSAHMAGSRSSDFGFRVARTLSP